MVARVFANLISSFFGKKVVNAMHKKGAWTLVPAEGPVQVEFPGEPKKPRNTSADTPFGKATSQTWMRTAAYDSAEAVASYSLSISQYANPPQEPRELLTWTLQTYREAVAKHHDVVQDQPVNVGGYLGHDMVCQMKRGAHVTTYTRYLVVGTTLMAASAVIPQQIAEGAADDLARFINSLRHHEPAERVAPPPP